MADKVTTAVRSRMMAAVRSRDTGPERVVRKALFAAGFRYRIHQRLLPGKPDIVLPRFKVAVFVHGCFWHGHQCPRGRRPTSNTAFWNAKLDGNLARDQLHRESLEASGWSVVTIWACDLPAAMERLLADLTARRRDYLRLSVRELTR